MYVYFDCQLVFFHMHVILFIFTFCTRLLLKLVPTCQYQSSDWLWRPPPKWPILLWRVGALNSTPAPASQSNVKVIFQRPYCGVPCSGGCGFHCRYCLCASVTHNETPREAVWIPDTEIPYIRGASWLHLASIHARAETSLGDCGGGARRATALR